MTSPRVALVVAPPWLCPTPPVEVALAAAYLATHGVTTQVFDLSVEVMDALWDPSELNPLAERMVAEWERLDARESLSFDEQRRYADLTPVAVSAESVIALIGWAKQILRDPILFFDHALYSRAQHVIDGANRLVSSAFAPSSVGSLTLSLSVDQRSIGQVLAMAVDEAHNPFLRLFRERFGPRLLAGNFELIAINVAHPEQIVPAFTLVRVLRDVGCRSHVTLFGYLEDYFSFTRIRDSIEAGDHASVFGLVDSIILYECERPLLALAEALTAKGDLDAVPSLLRLRAGRLRSNPVCEPVPIDDLPTPDYTGFPLDLYFLPERVFDYSASRGCYWGRCAFCEIGRPKRTYRCRSVELVLDDLVRIREQTGARRIKFVDQLVSPAFAARFSRALLERGLDVSWTCRARFEAAFTEDLLVLMRQAGCESIAFGLESATQRLLDWVQKGTRLEVVERVIEACGRAGIGVCLLTIGALPTETADEAQETKEFLLRYRQRIEGFNHSPFELYREAEMARNPQRYGIRREDTPGERTLEYRLDFGTTVGMARRDGGRTALAVRREVEALFQPSFLWPVHDRLYRAHYGSDLDTALRRPQPRELGAEELRQSRPRTSPAASWRRLRFDCEAINRRALPQDADGDRPDATALRPTPELAVCDLNRGSVWQVVQQAQPLLEKADGCATIAEIAAAVAPEWGCGLKAAEETCCSFYRQLAEAGVVTFTSDAPGRKPTATRRRRRRG